MIADKDKLALMLTHRCTRNCPGCANEGKHLLKKDMDLDVIDASLDLAHQKGIEWICLYGGEPSLYSDVMVVAELIKQKGFKCEITTNYDKPDVIEQLDGIVDRIVISCYQNQSEYPHRDNFKSELILNTTLWKDTFKDFEELDRFIDKYSMQFDDLEFQCPTNTSNYCEDSNAFLEELKDKCAKQGEIMLYRGFTLAQGVPNPLKVWPDGSVSSNWLWSVGLPNLLKD